MTEFQKGMGATLLFSLILGTIPAVTRLAVTTQMHVMDLWLLRCLIGGLIFLPILLYRLHIKKIRMSFLLTGIILAFCQGWGSHLLSISGMQFAPASHTSALGPGIISIWVAIWGGLLYKNHPSRSEALSFPLLVLGATFILINSGLVLNNGKMLLGDLFYLGSSCVSAIYLVYLKNNKLDPIDGAAVIACYSAIVASVVFAFSPHQSQLLLVPGGELALQIFTQGVLAGALIYVLIGYAINRVGAQQFTIIGSIIPIISIVTGKYIANDQFNILDFFSIITISIGIMIGTSKIKKIPVIKPISKI